MEEKGTRGHPRVRPKDASAIMVLDRSAGDIRVLVGKRSGRHAFMPDLYVFPGGRRDSVDNRLTPLRDYHPETFRMLRSSLREDNAARLRGLGICALRELFEETGLLDAGVSMNADLSALRYVARAITPPGAVRRYDTHFFACYCDEIGLSPDQFGDSNELSDVHFVPLTGDPSIKMPRITTMILGELHSFVTIEPSLRYGNAVPWYFNRRGQHVRVMIAESETR